VKDTNTAHSVAVRLLQRARAHNESYEHLLLRYGSERLLYRLSQSAAAAGRRHLVPRASGDQSLLSYS